MTPSTSSPPLDRVYGARASSNVNTPTHTRAPTASRDDDAFEDDAFDDVEASARDDGSMRARDGRATTNDGRDDDVSQPSSQP